MIAMWNAKCILSTAIFNKKKKIFSTSNISLARKWVSHLPTRPHHHQPDICARKFNLFEEQQEQIIKGERVKSKKNFGVGQTKFTLSKSN